MGKGGKEGLRLAQVVWATAKSFFIDDCYNKASALTFYTIQAIVPLLAFLLGIAKGFGLDSYLETLITWAFSQQKEILSYAIDLAHSMLHHIKGGVVAGFGVLFLLYTLVNLLQYIDTAFNDIWKLNTHRPIYRKVIGYVAALLLCPLIFAVSSSLTIYLKTQLIQLEADPGFEKVGKLLPLGFKLVPWILSCIVFFFFYYLIPDSTKKVWPKLIGALFAGAAFQLWQLLYITLQLKVFNYNAVYGTFAIIPLFLIWVQFSWLIALAGAELAAHLEIDRFPRSKYSKAITNRQLGLLILYRCFQTFYKGEKPLTLVDLSNSLNIPLNVTQKMVDLLIKGGILAEVQLQDGSTGFNPLKDGKYVKLNQVLHLIDSEANWAVLVENSEALKKITDRLHEIDDLVNHSEANCSISSLF